MNEPTPTYDRDHLLELGLNDYTIDALERLAEGNSNPLANPTPSISKWVNERVGRYKALNIDLFGAEPKDPVRATFSPTGYANLFENRLRRSITGYVPEPSWDVLMTWVVDLARRPVNERGILAPITNTQIVALGAAVYGIATEELSKRLNLDSNRANIRMAVSTLVGNDSLVNDADPTNPFSMTAKTDQCEAMLQYITELLE